MIAPGDEEHGLVAGEEVAREDREIGEHPRSEPPLVALLALGVGAAGVGGLLTVLQRTFGEAASPRQFAGYDGNGNLYRVGFAYLTPAYDELAPFALTHGFYDLIANSYSLNFYAAEHGGVKLFSKPFPSKESTPDSHAGSGIR